MTTERTRIWQDLLSVLSEEELLRIQRRLERKGDYFLVRLLEVELDKRGEG